MGEKVEIEVRTVLGCWLVIRLIRLLLMECFAGVYSFCALTSSDVIQLPSCLLSLILRVLYPSRLAVC